MAYFGGDYDNFTFPRHDLDVTFLRAYENGQPARTEHYLRWSAGGVTEGEFVVLAGYPGTTDRLLTVTQIRYQRDVGNPLQKQVWTARRDALAAYRAGRAPKRRAARTRQSDRWRTRSSGWRASRRASRTRESWRRKSRKSMRCERPSRRTRHGRRRTAMPGRASTPLMPSCRRMAPRIAFSTLTPSTAANHALSLVRYADGPDGNAARTALLSDAPLYPDLEEAVLGGWLEAARRTLGAG